MKRITSSVLIFCVFSLLLSFFSDSKIEGFEESAVAVSELTVPDNAQIIALGEATHGNVEFQQLKLDVLKVLVEKNDVRALALEGDFGGCEAVNKYILGGEGTAEEAVAAIGFQIYRTPQMAELAQWMREYNESAAPEEQLRFYGFDMQRTALSVQGVLDFYEKVDSEFFAELYEALNRLYAEGVSSADAQIASERRSHLTTTAEDLAQNREAYIAASSELEYEYACHYIDCLTQNLDLSQADMAQYSTLRDEYMAANVDWILKAEALRGNEKLMLAGHNGHVQKNDSSYAVMGRKLAENYGDAYFVIGTDYYKTTCNFPAGEGRANHSFKSGDPLAKAVKGADENMLYMDFADVTEPSLRAIIDAPMKMGSLGESYVWYMKVFSQTYRVEEIPTELFDAMIFVYKATPTEIDVG